MADSKLEPIYERLHGAPQYHPVNAETFADWAMEAGDVVTVSRNGEAHSAPVHSSTLRWRGKQQITINSEGAKEREAIAKMAKKKYGRGGSGVRNSAQMYSYEVNQEHLLYEVYDTQGRVSTLTVNVRGLYHEVYDTDGKFSVLQNTANGLYHEVYDTNGKFSKLQNTANGLYHEVYDTNGKFSTLQNTANGLYHEVYDTDGKFSTLQNTANGLYHEVYDTDGKFSTLQNTANGLYHEVYDTDGKFSTLQNTANGLYHEVYDTDGKFSTLQNTANGLYHEVYDTDGKFSTLQNTANGLYHEVYDTDGKFSTLQNTANGLYHEVYDTDGKFSALQNTANGLYHEVYDTNGKFSTLQNTVNGLYHEVYDTNGKFSTLQNTANGLYHEVYDTDGKFSTLQNTANGLYHEVYDPTTGIKKTLTTQGEAIEAEVKRATGKETQLEGKIFVEAGKTGLIAQLTDNRTVLSFPTQNQFPNPGSAEYLYLDLERGSYWQWNGTMYVGASGPGAVINAGAIVTSINEAGESEAHIDANKVYIGDQKSATVIQGKLNASDVTAEFIQTKLLNASSITLNGISTSGNASFSGTTYLSGTPYIQGTDGNNRDLRSGIRSLYKSSESGGTVTLQYIDFNGATHDVSFSRATSLSGAWSGSAHTVTASPQGNKYTVGIGGKYGDHSVELEVVANGGLAIDQENPAVINVPVAVNSLNSGQTAPTSRYTKSIPFSYASLLQAKSFISNGTKTPDAGYIGFSSVTVSISPTIGYSWSNSGQLTVTTSPAALENLVRRLYAGAATWDGATVSIPIRARWGNNDQYSEATNFNASATAPLETTDITANGTYTPSTGKIGFSSVKVTVPYATPTLSWNGSTGSSAGSSNNISASANGKTSAIDYVKLSSSSGTIYLKHSDSSSTAESGGGTVIGKLTDSNLTAGNIKNGVTIFGVTGTYSDYNNGWAAAHGKVGLPTAENTSTRFVASGPSSTVGEQLTHNYYVTADNDYAYLRFSSTSGTVVARASNPGYANGWGAAVGKVVFSGIQTGMTYKNRIWLRYPTAVVGDDERADFWLVDDPTNHRVNLWLGNEGGGTSAIWAYAEYSVPSKPSASDISLGSWQVSQQKPQQIDSYTDLTTLSTYIRNNRNTYIWFAATIADGTGTKWYRVATP